MAFQCDASLKPASLLPNMDGKGKFSLKGLPLENQNRGSKDRSPFLAPIDELV